MVTGYDKAHPDAEPHDHGFWKNQPCPVCSGAEQRAEEAKRPKKRPEDCKHERFGGRLHVHRLEDIARFIAEVEVHCAECGLPFSFTGLPIAISVERANLSIDGTELRLPIEPGPKPIPVAGSIPVEIPRRRES